MSKEIKFFNQKLTRREFIKKSAIALGGLFLGAYVVKGLLMKPYTYLKDKTFRNKAPDKLWKWSKEAMFYTTKGKEVNCQLCPHRCFININDRGFCRGRVNKDGKLYTIVYGNPCSVHIDPIEKKPVFHYLPGTKAFSIATAGCNLRCLYCQNWEIAQRKPEDTTNYDMMPEQTVALTLVAKQKDPLVRSIAYTYSEPVAFYEYMYDTAKIAKANGIKNLVISNGYLNDEPLKELAKVVDVIKIDFKGYNEKFYREVCAAELDNVLKSIKLTAKKSTWMELVYLVVPTLNDDMDDIKAMSEWLVDNKLRDFPMHFSRFHPQFRLTNLPPTPMETLTKARKIALDTGLNYVYIGNVPHGDWENTYCPKCKNIAIERFGYIIKQFNIKDGKCIKCGEKIAGIWGA